MRNVLIFAAAFGMLSVSFSAADAQKIDANGRCHDKSGKFAKMAVCRGAASMKGMAPLPAAPGPAHTYKLDPKGKCHDEKGKMAKKALCTS